MQTLYNARVDMDKRELTALVEARRDPDMWDKFHWTFLSSKHKYLWVSVAKAASITTTLLLREFEGKPFSDGDLWDESGLSKLKDCTTSEIVDILVSQDWFRFAFVRNPYDRLFSAYKSKIMDPNGEPWYQTVQDEIRVMFDYPELNGRRIGVVSFRDFVKYVQRGERSGDNHWVVQAEKLMMDMISYDFIGRFENFREDFQCVLNRLHAPENFLSKVSKVHGGTFKLPLPVAYDRELADIVYGIYEKDFETFGYKRDSWMFS